MLGIYVLLQLIIFIFSVFVFQTHIWLWHILPGVESYHMKWESNFNPFLTKMYSFYDSIQWAPITKQILTQKFGQDIGNLIMDYVKALNENITPNFLHQ